MGNYYRGFIGMALFQEELFRAFGERACCGQWCFALTAVLRKQRDGVPVESVLLGNLIAAVVAIPFVVRAPLADPMGWLILALMGFFQIGLSYILYTIALKKVSALEGVLVPLLEPLLNPVWVLIFTGEKPGIWALVGGAIVLCADPPQFSDGP